MTKEASSPAEPDLTPDKDARPKLPLSPAAERALAEAAARRAVRDAEAAAAGKAAAEFGGQSGPDPVRYGDWEKGGIVSDF